LLIKPALFDKKQGKNSNIGKYYYNLGFTIQQGFFFTLLFIFVLFLLINIPCFID